MGRPFVYFSQSSNCRGLWKNQRRIELRKPVYASNAPMMFVKECGKEYCHMETTDLLPLFDQLGVVSKGHFVLSSGRHSSEYWEKFRLLEWPRMTAQLCSLIASRYQNMGIEAVTGPTTGGALLAQEEARQLDVRCLIAEPLPNGG